MKRNRLHKAVRGHVHPASGHRMIKSQKMTLRNGRVSHTTGGSVTLSGDARFSVKPGGIIYKVGKWPIGDDAITQDYVDRLKAIGADPSAIDFAQRQVRDHDAPGADASPHGHEAAAG